MKLTVELYEPAAEEEIVAVEAELGLRLPEAYRAWLKSSNGAALAEQVALPGIDGSLIEIDDVGEVPGNNKSSGSELIPDGYLPITVGQGGSLTLKVEGEDQGSVWWASSAQAEAEGIVEGPSQEIMHRLADDWDAFLAMDFAPA